MRDAWLAMANFSRVSTGRLVGSRQGHKGIKGREEGRDKGKGKDAAVGWGLGTSLSAPVTRLAFGIGGRWV